MLTHIRFLGTALGVLVSPLPSVLKRSLAQLVRWKISVLPGRLSSFSYLVGDALLKRAFRGSRVPARLIRTFPWKVRMQLDVAQKTQRALYLKKTYEPEVLHYIEKQLGPNDGFIDIGANVGFYALYAATRIKRNGGVFAFEPEPKNFTALKRNIELNGLFHLITAVNKAVGDRAGTETFYINPWNEGGGSLNASDTFHDDEQRFTKEETARHFPRVPLTTMVEVTTLDAYIAKEKINLPHPLIIKIDIEGAELSALRGMQDLLKHGTPRIICEVSQDGIAISAFLAQYRYRPFSLSLNGVPTLLSTMPERMKTVLFLKEPTFEAPKQF